MNSMPVKLSTFLYSLNGEEADKLWEWLDANPRAFDEMIDIVAPIAIASGRGIEIE